jgi:hypothetical protein
MGRMRAVSLACAVAMLAALTLAGPTTAARTTAVSGTWDWDNLTWNEKVVGEYLFFNGTEETARTGWSGSFEGTSFDTFQGVIFPSGTLVATLTVHFDGTVLGESGKMTMEVTCLATDESFGGRWVIRNGTGGLKGVHGYGTWGDHGNPLVEYAGKVSW